MLYTAMNLFYIGAFMSAVLGSGIAALIFFILGTICLGAQLYAKRD